MNASWEATEGSEDCTLLSGTQVDSAVYLGAHAIVGLEEMPCVREQLAIGRMIDRFDCRNFRRDAGMCALEMRVQFGLRAGGADDQDGAGMRDGSGDALEELLVHRCVTAVPGIRLVVQVFVRVGAVHDGSLVHLIVEAKHFGGLMIDPDQCVVVICHVVIVAGGRRERDTGHPLHIRVVTNAVRSAAPENPVMRINLGIVRLAGLAAVSPACAVVGGWIDERTHLGFTNWRSACRASGISPASLLHFTLELLPMAVIGALLGGTVVLMGAMVTRNRPQAADACLAAHLGCAIAMPLGLLLCALAIPVPVMLIVEIAAALVAAYSFQVFFIRSATYGGAAHRVVARIPENGARLENFSRH
jgi:hypothetical protein